MQRTWVSTDTINGSRFGFTSAVSRNDSRVHFALAPVSLALALHPIFDAIGNRSGFFVQVGK
ncbi:MAG: hypothetical protein EBU59_10395, partial [Planctomycetia bacterium]|nr:hypothetical protein [Planctomycetia bacterium]